LSGEEEEGEEEEEEEEEEDWWLLDQVATLLHLVKMGTLYWGLRDMSTLFVK
jgi:ribosomal silencing factor RsfS